MTDYAILIVTYGSAEELPGCMRAIARMVPPPAELVVIDCASEDDSLATARTHAPASIPSVIESAGGNLGFSGGMNLALARSRAPFVLTLNADARPAPDFAARLIAAAEHDPENPVAAVAGRLSRPSEEGDPPRLDACGMRLTPTWRHLDRGSGERDVGQYDLPERVFGATGAASLFRREALEDAAIDGEVFALEFHSFREDAELCFRLRERGWEILYEPTARAVHRRHNRPSRRRDMAHEINRRSLQNRYLLRAYHQTIGNALTTLLPTLWRDALAFGYVLLRERTSLPAYGWLWRRRRTILERRRRIQARRRAPSSAIHRWFLRSSLPR